MSDISPECTVCSAETIVANYLQICHQNCSILTTIQMYETRLSGADFGVDIGADILVQVAESP